AECVHRGPVEGTSAAEDHRQRNPSDRPRHSEGTKDDAARASRAAPARGGYDCVSAQRRRGIDYGATHSANNVTPSSAASRHLLPLSREKDLESPRPAQRGEGGAKRRVRGRKLP